MVLDFDGADNKEDMMSVRGNAYVVGPWTEVGEEERKLWAEHYNRIGEMLWDVGFQAFLPHQMLAGLPPGEMARKLRKLLRESKLVVADLSVTSPDAEAILRRLRRGKKRSVIVLRHVLGDRIDSQTLENVRVLQEIDYMDNRECVERLRRYLLEVEYSV